MAQKCNGCEDGELLAEDGCFVCTKCGLVSSEETYFDSNGQSEGAYCNSYGAFQSDLSTSGRRDFKVKAAKQYLPKWKDVILNGGVALRLTPENIKEATKLFEDAYSEASKEFLLRKESYKRGLCAACLHITCQRNRVNIGVANIWEVVQAEGSAFHKAMKDLKRLLDVHIKVCDRFDDISVQMCLNKYGLELLTLKEETSQIIGLAKDLLVHEGCKAEPLILAAAFIAWQKENGFKTTIKDFKIQGGSSILTSVNIRLSELRKMLHHFVVKISWIDSSTVKPKEAVRYLSDIIRYQQSQMLSRCLSDSENEETGENETRFKPKRPKSSHSNSTETVHRTLTKWDGHDLNCSELSEKDIPDTEIHHYIYNKSKPALV